MEQNVGDYKSGLFEEKCDEVYSDLGLARYYAFIGCSPPGVLWLREPEAQGDREGHRHGQGW